LLFLDYIATSKLELKKALRLVEGIVEGCAQAGCTLLGGETAEMPGMYKKGDYEVAGFALGWVREEDLMKKENVHPGDLLVGIASSGLHSNGYSLVRKIIFEGKKEKKAEALSTFSKEVGEMWEEKFPTLSRKEEKAKFLHTFSPALGKTWGEELLTPTRIYAKSIISLWDREIKIKGIAHITGGGIPGNLSRILPPGRGARIKRNWETPKIFSLLQEMGRVKDEEMFQVFNMGLGLILVISPAQEKEVRKHLESKGETTYLIGEITEGDNVKIE
ncbi:MAG: phosphoribosylformylglycinamidine cyclo-ligase, partial [Caldiserica bacterium]|nr:phosphoribosylformylglycinamidine cyclo-ligase [Caldisericota bacterium]